MGWEFKSPLAHLCALKGARRSRLVVNPSTVRLSPGRGCRPGPLALPRYKYSSIGETFVSLNRQLLVQ